MSTLTPFQAVNAPEIRFSLDTANFDDFEIHLNGIKSSYAADNLLMQFSTDNGVTWAGSYPFTLRKWGPGASAPVVFSGPGSQFVLAMNVGSGTSNRVDGWINLAGLTFSVKTVSSDLTLYDNASQFWTHEMEGGVSMGTVTDVRIYMGTGTITGTASLLSTAER